MAVGSIGDFFTQLRGVTKKSGIKLSKEITDALGSASDGADLEPMQMLDLQFKMGQFNAIVEATSSITKGLTDTAKTLAQRAGG